MGEGREGNGKFREEGERKKEEGLRGNKMRERRMGE
jgi:hypothetical protein